jgi:hypothetical protein
VETLLRKYLWAVDGLVIALCAMFLARATATAVERKMLSAGPAPKPAMRAPVAAAAPVYSKQVEEILKRNIFCSTCPPILPVAGGFTFQEIVTPDAVMFDSTTFLMNGSA